MNNIYNLIPIIALIIHLCNVKINTIDLSQFSKTCGNKLSIPELHRCYCDANCRRFDDCCANCTYQSTSKLRQIRALMKCYPLQINNRTTSHLFIAKCRLKWRDAKVREECEKDTPEALFPITARRSRLVFKNEACAKCHKTKLKNKVYWRSFKICQHSDYGTPRCYLNFKKPKRKSTLRPCLPNVISYCPPSWKNETIKKLCLSSCSHVYIKDRSEIRIYKNYFCVQCHGENITELNNQMIFNNSENNVNLIHIKTMLEKLEENKTSHTEKELADHQVVKTEVNMPKEELTIFDSLRNQKPSYAILFTLHCPEGHTAITINPKHTLICIPNSDIKCPGDMEFINGTCKIIKD